MSDKFVFIAYTSENKPEVKRLSRALESAGIKTYWDDQLLPGDTWKETIADKINGSSAFIFCMSKELERREKCVIYRELNHAIDVSLDIPPDKTFIIPVRFSDCNPPKAALDSLRKLKDIHYIDLFPSNSFQDGIHKLKQAINKTIPYSIISASEEYSHRARLFNVPNLSRYHMKRSEYMDEIKENLLYGHTHIGIAGQSSDVGIQGMGGIGKSETAAAIAWDHDIQEMFPDGIVWIIVGQKPDMTTLQQEVAGYFEDYPPDFQHPNQGRNYLSKLFIDKKVLLILDDVWKVSQGNAFNVTGEDGMMLITSRLINVLDGLEATTHQLDLLSSENALEMLREYSHISKTNPLPLEAEEIVKECGYLPLAIAMIGSMVRHKPLNRWTYALNRLRNADIDKINRDHPTYLYPDLLKAMDVSVTALDPTIRNRYLDMAVFPEDWAIPEKVFETYWANVELDENPYYEIIDIFVDSSLAFRDSLNRIVLHDLQYDYLRKKALDLPNLHKRIVDAYWELCSDGWASGPDDGYFQRYITHHLIQSNQKDISVKAAKELLYGVPGMHPISSSRCFKLLNNEEQKNIARELVSRNSAHYSVLWKCLNILGKEAKAEAKRLICDETTHFIVICKCLNILGYEAKAEAIDLLENEKTNRFVICKCLDIFRYEAKAEAKRLLKKRKEHEIICKCLKILGQEAKEKALEFLENKKTHHFVICNCLDIL